LDNLNNLIGFAKASLIAKETGKTVELKAELGEDNRIKTKIKDSSN
jgi:hypothetical protein